MDMILWIYDFELNSSNCLANNSETLSLAIAIFIRFSATQNKIHELESIGSRFSDVATND